MTKITKYTIIVSVILFVTSFLIGKGLSENIIFIFEQPYVFIGSILRNLSLSGVFGNLIAILLYILISGIPLWILGYLVLNKKVIRIDYIFLPIITISLFALMYLMINQNFVIEMLPPILTIPVLDGDLAALRIYNVGIVMTFYALLLIYSFIKFFLFNKVSIYKLVNFIIYLILFVVLSKTLLFETSIVMNSEPMNSYDTAQMILSYLLQIASASIISFILIHFHELSLHLSYKVIDLNLVQLTKKISKLSLLGIVVIFSGFLIINLFQIIFSNRMLNIGFTLNIPIFELLLVMVMLLITEYIKQTYDIHEDNALTI